MLARKNYYRAYANLYDAFKGDRSSNIQLVKELVEKYRPNPHLVLDLACGTGSIAQGLVGSFDIIGLDSSPHMLQVAKNKLPNMQFVQGDMSNFSLTQRFDVVYCLHNSVNHLLSFQQWKNMFHTVAEHLQPGGLFIFDINPVSKMEHLAILGPSIKQVGTDYVITQVFKDKEIELYVWDIKILLKNGNKYTVKQEPVKVSSYPSSQIIDALQAEFKTVEQLEPQNHTMPDDAGRVYYVCKKS